MPEPAIKVNPTKEWALWYSTQGWSVVPVGAGAKVPTLAWTQYQQIRASEETIIQWFDDAHPRAGVGIVTGAISGIFVIDVDEGIGKPGGDTLQELQIANDDLPETMTVHTGGGGRHFYFRMPNNIRIKSGRDILGPGIDVRGDGGFVVAPPSIHPNGKPYKWDARLRPGEVEIAGAPDWLIALVRNDAVGARVAPSSTAQINAFGKRTDGREEYMRDLVWARMIEERHICPIAPEGDAQGKIIDELWSIYERQCKARGHSLEADGRGRKLLEGKVAHALKHWDGKLADDAACTGNDGVDGDETPLRAVGRLSRLSRLDYERCRKDEAKGLGMRPTALDQLVEEARRSDADDTSDLGLFEPEPCDTPVDGAELLNSLVDDISRYVVMPLDVAIVVALWAVHAHAFECWRHTPRLHVTAPEKGCGKSTLLDVLSFLVPRGIKTENISTAVLFRAVDKYQPTLLIDEVDSFLRDNEELRGCLNAGHASGGRHFRCEGDKNEIKGFRTFAPAVLAGIGNIPATLADRSIRIVLQKRRSDEPVESFRDDRAQHLQSRAGEIARWVRDHGVVLRAAGPDLPGEVQNRLADNWRPLVAIADVAGGDWPNRARAALATLTLSDQFDGESLRVQLLTDIRTIFHETGKDRLTSEQLVERLCRLEDRPWPEYGRPPKEITKTQMARLLKPFGVAPGNIRVADAVKKGYQLSQFEEPFSRYLPD